MDAGFVFNMPKTDAELDHLPVAMQHVELAVPKGHALARMKNVRLRDLVDASFVWFPRREAPAFYDRLMHKCFRGGLKSPRIVQEGLNESTILSLVSHGMGVAVLEPQQNLRSLHLSYGSRPRLALAFQLLLLFRTQDLR